MPPDLNVNEDRAIGPPGCGKTTFLAEVINYDAREYGPDAVIAVSHTRAAAAELAGKKTAVPRDNVGTLHSFAYRALGRPPLAEKGDALKDFCEAHPQWRMEGATSIEEVEFGTMEGDNALSDYSRFRNLCLPREAWPLDTLQFAQAWEGYKADTGTIDFTDMIDLAARDTDCADQVPRVMVLDEAQDTSRLQWQLVRKWAAHSDCEKLVTAGDPDQAIFVWAGADPSFFRDVKPARLRVLCQNTPSYRVPRAVHALAVNWIEQIADRDSVTYIPRDADGSVQRTGASTKYPEPLLPLIEETLDAGKTIMIQATCGYMLQSTLAMLRREGLPFQNPWRVKQGVWNPLAVRGENSTVQALRDYLAPYTTGNAWSKLQIERWSALLKGLFIRTGREQFASLPVDMSPEDALGHLARLMQDPDQIEHLLQPPPQCLSWIEQHALAGKEKALEFPCHVVRQRGVEALAEEPRVFVGSCHSFKGSQADVNVVFPDLSFAGYAQWVGDGRDDIIRLFYVAYTRTREDLHLASPSTGMAVWG